MGNYNIEVRIRRPTGDWGVFGSEEVEDFDEAWENLGERMRTEYFRDKEYLEERGE
jgi:hypothetical protein